MRITHRPTGISVKVQQGRSQGLNRFLARSGVASRRAADELIASGSVRVNGEVAPPSGILVDPDKDEVTVDGRAVKRLTRHRYLMLNKPLGVITTAKDEGSRTTVLDAVGDEGLAGHRLFPVGRLDADTTGLLVLTDDGDLAFDTNDRPFDDRAFLQMAIAERFIDQLGKVFARRRGSGGLSRNLSHKLLQTPDIETSPNV